MSDDEETPLVQAERHVLEGEKRVARQRAMIEEMERDQHPETAELGRKVLESLQETLRLSREHLELERQKKGVEETKRQVEQDTAAEPVSPPCPSR